MSELAGVVPGRAIRRAQQNMADLARYGLVSQTDTDTLILYNDDRGWVFGNPRRSYGYVYVTAFLHAHVPMDAQVPMRSAILGAKASTYLLASAQAGKPVTVAVTGSRTGYTAVTRTSASTVEGRARPNPSMMVSGLK